MRSPTDDGAAANRLSDVVKLLKETGTRSPLRLTNEELREEMQVLETVKRLADARDAQLLAKDHRRHQQLKPGKDEWRPSSAEWLQEHRQISSSAA